MLYHQTSCGDYISTIWITSNRTLLARCWRSAAISTVCLHLDCNSSRQIWKIAISRGFSNYTTIQHWEKSSQVTEYLFWNWQVEVEWKQLIGIHLFCSFSSRPSTKTSAGMQLIWSDLREICGICGPRSSTLLMRLGLDSAITSPHTAQIWRTLSKIILPSGLTS